MNRSRSMNVGVTSLAVIFTVIALTVFAVLTWSSALNEKRLAEKYAASVQDYWAADTMAAEIAEGLYIKRSEGAGARELAEYAAALGAIDAQGDGGTVSYVCRIDDTRILCVTLEIADGFQITEWCTASADGWQADDTLELYGG